MSDANSSLHIPQPQVSGRGAKINPGNRFLKIQIHEDLEHVEYDEERPRLFFSMPGQAID